MVNTEGDVTAERVNNRYSLVVLAAKRAKQLKEGSPSLIETTSTNSLTVALEEIASGKVTYTDAVEPPLKGAVADDAPVAIAESLEDNFLSVSSSAGRGDGAEALSADLAAFLPIGDDAGVEEEEESEDIDEDADEDPSELSEKA